MSLFFPENNFLLFLFILFLYGQIFFSENNIFIFLRWTKMSLPQGCIWCNSLQPDMVHLKVHTLTCCERRPLDCSICKLIYTDEMLIAHFDCPFRRPENDVQMRNRFLRLSALILLNNELYPLPGDPTESEVVQLAISRFMLSKDSMQLVTVRSP